MTDTTVTDVVKIVTRTAIGGQVLSSIFFGKNHDLLEHSTLNELIDDSLAIPYQPSVATAGLQQCEPYDSEADVKHLSLDYIAIGIKGHTSITDSNGIAVTLPVNHKATNTGLYQIVPFVVKRLEDDLTDEQRAKFRLRKVLLINGELYAAYYLRKLNTQNVTPTLLLHSVDNGKTTKSTWVPTVEDLRPAQPTIGYANDASYITTVCNVQFDFDEQDTEWYLDAMELLFGQRNYAITELAYCTGVDKPITSQYPATGTQTPSTTIANRQLKEAVGVQVAFFVNTVLSATVLRRGFDFDVDIGLNEPLFTNNKR